MRSIKLDSCISTLVVGSHNVESLDKRFVQREINVSNFREFRADLHFTFSSVSCYFSCSAQSLWPVTPSAQGC
jgi:hypothetical protein